MERLAEADQGGTQFPYLRATSTSGALSALHSVDDWRSEIKRVWARGAAYLIAAGTIHPKLFGHLFSGRYKSLIVDGSQSGYLRTVCDYVHLNPVRAKLITPEQKLSEHSWSSYVEYLKPADRRPLWLRVDRLFGEMRIPKDSPAGRRQFELNLEQRRAEETRQQWKGLRRGWYLGDEAFRQELLEAAHAQVGESHYGRERQESAEEKGRRIVREELQQRHWTETTLSQRRKGDPAKVQIAQRLRAETTVTLKWIATHLEMGTWTHVANRLYHAPRMRQ